ncbi:hypothetical protein IAE22_33135, partial [Bacillus sp. S34]|nr:hypothetical protein [Bacillus sp. S34]
ASPSLQARARELAAGAQDALAESTGDALLAALFVAGYATVFVETARRILADDRHEDVRLVERARALGFDVRATTELPVVPSGRFDGRTPGGYAEHLRRTYGDAS